MGVWQAGSELSQCSLVFSGNSSGSKRKFDTPKRHTHEAYMFSINGLIQNKVETENQGKKQQISLHIMVQTNVQNRLQLFLRPMRSL